MPIPGFFDRSMQLMQKALDLRTKNQQVISSNIANADTPGYQPARLEFTKQLERALKTPDISQPDTNPRHFPIDPSLSQVEGNVKVLRTPPLAGDRSSVNVDQEMVSLAENQIAYEATVQMLNKKLGLLKYVAQDGR